MPPPIIRRIIAQSSPSFQPCKARSRLLRSFSTTKPAQEIGPESPKFIEVPQPLQSLPLSKPRIKGILPPPREIFPRRGPNKMDPKFIAAATKEPSSYADDYDIRGPRGDLIAWKRRMAEMRRRNLREGLVGLYQRKRRVDQARESRSVHRRAEREALLYKPERHDVRLTSPTIPSSLEKLQSGPPPDPEREQRIAEKAVVVQAIQAEKERDRRDSLHALYMQAREFITTEEQLNEAIERIFVPSPKEFVGNNRSGSNIWNTGAPETVQDMLDKVGKAEKSALGFHSGTAAVTHNRVRRIAEELTGGKM